MITIDTTIGDTVVNWYGETGVIVGLSPRGGYWRVRSVSGRETLARRITTDTVVVTATIEGGK